MDPSAERRPLSTPAVTPAETPHSLVEQECRHQYASRNEPSPSLTTLYPSATTDAPAASGVLKTLISGCVPALFICFTLVHSRDRKRRFSSSPRAHQFANRDSLAFTLVFVLPCLVLPFWVGLLPRYASSPFTPLGTSSRTANPPRGRNFPVTIARAVSLSWAAPTLSRDLPSFRYIGDSYLVT